MWIVELNGKKRIDFELYQFLRPCSSIAESRPFFCFRSLGCALTYSWNKCKKRPRGRSYEEEVQGISGRERPYSFMYLNDGAIAKMRRNSGSLSLRLSRSLAAKAGGVVREKHGATG